jgi:hypothetical protein
VTAPNPGSDEALALGCRCAVLDNGHGRTPPMVDFATGAPSWWINADCPVHFTRQYLGMDDAP